MKHDSGATVTLSAEQFDALCALLEPGFKLASAMLAERKAATAATKAPQPADIAAG